MNTPDSAIADSSAPTTLTVDGTVYGYDSDTTAGLANRKVVIVDANDVVTELNSDASGKFHTTGVMPPYDVSVPYEVTDAASAVYPYFYSGLTTAKPEIGTQDYNFPSHPMQLTTIQFTSTICSGCQLTLSGPQRTTDPVTGTGSLQAFEISYEWYGSATLSAPLHIVLADGVSGAYTMRAEIPSTALVASGTTTLDPPSFTAITSGTFALTTAIPADYTYNRGDLYVESNSAPDFSSFIDAKLLTTSTSTKYPIIPGANLNGDVSATGPGGESSYAYLNYPIASAPASMAVTLPTASQITAPANNAVSVTNAQSLTWTAYGTDAVYEIDVQGGNMQFKIFTTATSLSLAKLAKAEIALAPAAAYDWTVDGETNQATVFGTFDTPPAMPTTFDGESQAFHFTTQ